MRAGKLRLQATIQQQVETIAADGDVARAWVTFKAVCCDIVPQSGLEREQADKLKSLTTHNLWMRYFPGVNSAMRVVWNSQTFNILDVVPDRTFKKRLQLKLQEITDP